MKSHKLKMLFSLVLVLGLIITVAECQRNESRAPFTLVAKHAREKDFASEPSSGSVDADEAIDKPISAQISERKLIARISLTLEVEKIKDPVIKAEGIAKEFGGYVSDSRIYQEETSESATLVLMIPIQNLDRALAKLRELGKVRYEQKTTEDVTRQFIDSQARIKNLQREEEALARLLERSGKLADILEVERELARVRTEIDQIQGELRFLEHQTSYSTLTLNLSTKPLPPQYEAGSLKNSFIRAWRAFRATLHGLVVLAIYALFFVPLIIVLIAIIYFIIKLLKRLIRGKRASGDKNLKE